MPRALWLVLVDAPEATMRGLSLVATYALHAALWATGAALLSRVPSLSAATRRGLFLLALLGPLASTLASTALSPRPGEARSTLEVHAVLTLAGESRADDGVVVPGTRAPRDAGSLALAGLLAAAALGLGRYLVAWRALRRGLRARRAMRDARARACLERVCARASFGPVLLSESTRLVSPLVVGTSEICLPAHLPAILSDAELEAVLAHEVAHLERRDGLWFPLVSLVEAVFWLQPSNHWLGAAFRSAAEVACDGRALVLTGDAWSLARALVLVAEKAHGDTSSALLPAMARARGSLLVRVRHLVAAAEGRAPRAHTRASVLVGLAAVGLLATTARIELARATPVQSRGQQAIARDAADPSQALGALAVRMRQVEEELAIIPAEDAVRADTLHQELRHARAMAQWLEARAERAWSADHHEAPGDVAP